MSIKTRAAIVWPITWTMLMLFAFCMFFFHSKTRWLWTPMYLVFIVLDILYNWTIGAFIFWEHPLETNLFTDRLEEHKYGMGANQTDESKELALYYCKRLDKYDPGHCA